MKLPIFLTTKTGIVSVLIPILILAIGGGSYAFFINSKKDSPNSQQNNISSKEIINYEEEKLEIPSTSSNRVKGQAGDEFPYGKIDAAKVINYNLDPEGGVVFADLANNIKAYVIIPSNYGREDVVRLTPYFSMPTSAKAPALSNELGYGVDIELQDSGFDILQIPFYLVFDLDQGKTIKTILKDEKLSSFCSPTLGTFDPAICALINKVPVQDHTNLKYGVVSPVRTPEYADVMFMSSTIPMGYENLIVTRITRQGTYIPQKLSKDLVTDLVKANKHGFTIPQTEALIHRINNDIYFDAKDPDFSSPITNISDIYEYPKAIYSKDKYKEFLKGNIASFKIDPNDSNQFFKKSYLESELQRVDESLLTLSKDMMEKFTHYSKTSRDAGDILVSAAAQNRRLELADYAGSEEKRIEMAINVNKDIRYFMPDKDFEVDERYFPMVKSMAVNLPDKFKLAENSNSTTTAKFSLFPASKAEGETPPTPEQLAEQAKSDLNHIAENTLNNPDASLSDLAQAAQAAQLAGNEELADKIREKMKEKIKETLEDLDADLDDIYRAWMLADTIGVSDDDPEIDEKFRQKALKRIDWEICHDKTLKNFATQNQGCIQK